MNDPYSFSLNQRAIPPPLPLADSHSPFSALPMRAKKGMSFCSGTTSARFKRTTEPSFSSINSKIIYLLKEWQDEHRSLIEFNDDQYQRNVMKVLGGNMSQEFINSRVKNMLFNKLKFNLKEVVEFEFI